jgi:hypothetical protein
MDTLVSAVASGLCFVSIVWRLILSMIDLLLEAVPILNLQAYVTYPAVTDYSTSYCISGKYRSDLRPELYACFFLCYFDAVQTENGTFSSDSFMMGDD